MILLVIRGLEYDAKVLLIIQSHWSMSQAVRIEECFSKWTIASASSGNLLEMKIFRTRLDLLNQKFEGRAQHSVLIGPSGDPFRYGLRSTCGVRLNSAAQEIVCIGKS